MKIKEGEDMSDSSGSYCGNILVCKKCSAAYGCFNNGIGGLVSYCKADHFNSGDEGDERNFCKNFIHCPKIKGDLSIIRFVPGIEKSSKEIAEASVGFCQDCKKELLSFGMKV